MLNVRKIQSEATGARRHELVLHLARNRYRGRRFSDRNDDRVRVGIGAVADLELERERLASGADVRRIEARVRLVGIRNRDVGSSESRPLVGHRVADIFVGRRSVEGYRRHFGSRLIRACIGNRGGIGHAVDNDVDRIGIRNTAIANAQRERQRDALADTHVGCVEAGPGGAGAAQRDTDAVGLRPAVAQVVAVGVAAARAVKRDAGLLVNGLVDAGICVGSAVGRAAPAAATATTAVARGERQQEKQRCSCPDTRYHA